MPSNPLHLCNSMRAAISVVVALAGRAASGDTVKQKAGSVLVSSLGELLRGNAVGFLTTRLTFQGGCTVKLPGVSILWYLVGIRTFRPVLVVLWVCSLLVCVVGGAVPAFPSHLRTRSS